MPAGHRQGGRMAARIAIGAKKVSGFIRSRAAKDAIWAKKPVVCCGLKDCAGWREAAPAASRLTTGRPVLHESEQPAGRNLL